MEIRYITPEDNALEISRIYEKGWKYAYQNIIPQNFLDSIPAGKWARHIRAAGINTLILLENGSAVGTSSFGASRWEKYSDYGEIISIYFLPEYMRKGSGSQLLNQCIEELKKLGFYNILLRVLEDNRNARSFYEKNGFVFSGEYYQDNIGGKELREMLYVYHTGERHC